MADEGARNARAHPGPGAMAVHACGQAQKSGAARASQCPYVVHTSSVRFGTSSDTPPWCPQLWLMKGPGMLGHTQARVQWLSTRVDKRKRVAQHGPHSVHTSSIRRPYASVRPGTRPHGVHMAYEGARNARAHPGPGVMAVHACGQAQKNGAARASQCPYVVHTSSVRVGASRHTSTWCPYG